MIDQSIIIAAVIALLVIVVLFKGSVIVPQKQQYVIERLGKYNKTLDAGFHILVPFMDRVAYNFNLKEEVFDIPAQTCITRDNVTVEVDGLIYLQVIDPHKAAYGIVNYRVAAAQLAQTTLRSSIGKIELDKTFEEREAINQEVVSAVDEAAVNWGVKVLRYEVKDITPPQSVKVAMEAQMTAEREKRAAIARSEGERQSTINRAEGQQQDMILRSQGERQKVINEANGKAEEIRQVAEATAAGIRAVAQALAEPGGDKAMNLRIAENYLVQFGNIAKQSTTLIVPQNLSDLAGTVGSLATALEKVKG